MAKKVTVALTDDKEAYDGNDAISADQTVEFSLDGVTYEIDLCAKNAMKLRTDIEQWAHAARRTGGRGKRGTAKKVTATPRAEGGIHDMDADQRRAAREWLRNNTTEYANLGSRGRIPDAGLELFHSQASASA